LTYTRPKVLLPIANKPIIQHLVDDLISLGVNEIIIVTNYMEDRIKKLFSGYKNIKFVHQEKLNGTADAFGKANFVKEIFFALNGDEVVSKEDLDRLMKKHKEKKALVTVGAMRINNPERFGVLISEKDKIVEIIEKPKQPPDNLINTGLYIFEPEFFEFINKTKKSARNEYEITDSIQMVAKETNRVFYCEVKSWQYVSIIWDLLDANKAKLEEMVKKSGKNLIVEENVKIKDNVTIEGNVVIGSGSEIGPSCYIRGDTSIGRNCKVGNGCEIKNCVIMDNTKIPHLSYVGDSVIGENCNLGAGTKVANVRHDNQNVKVLVKGEVCDSGKKKLGVFMGDYTKTGINTVIYPGMVLGPFSWTIPNGVVDKNLEPFHLLADKKILIDKNKIEGAIKNPEDKELMKSLYEKLKKIIY
jgi:bifunctional UDP-N-acetylglucosamine pyrophosphorylase/glucosamine-1-phosphate N-acetyltransferase